MLQLESVFLPDSATDIHATAFVFCPNLKRFDGDNHMIVDGGLALLTDTGILMSVRNAARTFDFPDSVTVIGEKSERGLLNIVNPSSRWSFPTR